MSEEITIYHPRMKKMAVISVVVGFGLGFMAVQAQRIQTGNPTPWNLALPYGALAAIMLYAITYRNLKKLEEVGKLD